MERILKKYKEMNIWLKIFISMILIMVVCLISWIFVWIGIGTYKTLKFVEQFFKLEINMNIAKEHYIYYFVYFTTIIVTGVFSFLVYRSSEKSYELSKSIKDKQDANELNKKKENALIVFYDLLLGLDDLKKLYIGVGITSLMTNVPQRMFFSNEWIKNVALISNDNRIINSINDIYMLYGELLTIQSILEKDDLLLSGTPARKLLEATVKTASVKVFNPEILAKQIKEFRVVEQLKGYGATEVVKGKGELEKMKDKMIFEKDKYQEKWNVMEHILNEKYYNILLKLNDIIDNPKFENSTQITK